MDRKILSLALGLTVLWLAAFAADERSTEIVAPGLLHHILVRGDAATTASYHVVLGVFDHQSEADLVLERARSRGFTAYPHSSGGDYFVITQGLPNRSEAEDLRHRLIEKGFQPPLQIEQTSHDLRHPQGPWKIHVLEVDPAWIEVQVAHATDAAIGLETTADLANRRGALAAVNGGYFYMTGPFAGDSRGALEIDDRLLSEPDRGRASVGFFDQEGATRSVFGRLGFRSEIHLGSGKPIPIDGINRKRNPSEVVLFTPEFHPTTLTSPEGAEIVIRDGNITDFRRASGNSVIPAAGMVLSIGSERLDDVPPQLRPGDQVSVETKLLPLLPDADDNWGKARHILSGGPLLLWNGKRLEEPEKESISMVFFLARHPRTAVGAREDGTLLLVTVDGRRPGESVGMSLPELTDLMLELGCVSAINLDGGGSTTMVVDGKVVNSPSGGEARRNADAILLFPKRP